MQPSVMILDSVMAPNTTLTLRLCAVALLRNIVRLHDGRFGTFYLFMPTWLLWSGSTTLACERLEN